MGQEITCYQWIDLLLKALTFLVAGTTAIKALMEYSVSVDTRARELKWKQAEAAKKHIDEWMAEVIAFNACRMFEYNGRYFTNESGLNIFSTFTIVKQALRSDNLHNLTKEEIYIRDCMDAFLYYTELMDQGIKGGLYEVKHLKFPLGYYLDCVVKNGLKPALSNYIEAYNFPNSESLFENFLEWSQN